ncbi:MAG: MFS transporter [Succinivibrio sp.]|nr:MFS transporter [Succinivibrio sp.]
MKLQSVFDRVLNLRSEETNYAVLSFLLFFCIFCSYSVLRPVRDTMGIASGVDSLQWLFSATFAVSVAVQIPYFYVLGKISRKIILPVVFSFFGTNLLLFACLMAYDIAPVLTGRIFYIWLSVYNLAVVSLGWSVLNDLLKPSQSRRLFAIAASGSSAGSVAGPMITSAAVKYTGIFPLILISLFFLALASVAVYFLFSIRSAQCTADETTQGENYYLKRRISGSITE